MSHALLPVSYASYLCVGRVNLDSKLARSFVTQARRNIWNRRARMPPRLLAQTFGRWHSGKFTDGTPGAAFAGRISKARPNSAAPDAHPFIPRSFLKTLLPLSAARPFACHVLCAASSTNEDTITRNSQR